MNLAIQNNNSQFEPLISHVEQTRCAINATAAAVVIIQNDQIVTEWYSGYHHAKAGASPVTFDSQFNVYSIRKTHIALALAFAVIDAGLDLDTPIHPYIDDISLDELETITVRNVLTKTKPKFFGPEKVEGEGLAARIIKNVTGRTVSQLITEKILIPLQLKNTEWVAVPKESLVCDFTAGDGYASVRLESDEGHERNLYMSAKDLAYWGYLYLNNGVDDLFEAYGATGCHVVVIPKYNAVVVRMYNRYATEHTETLLNCLQQNASNISSRKNKL